MAWKDTFEVILIALFMGVWVTICGMAIIGILGGWI